MLEAAREKGQVTYKGTPIRLTADLSVETLQARRDWGPIVNIPKEIPTQNFISSQTKLHKWRRNRILFRQVNAEGIGYQQTYLTRAPEGSAKYGKDRLLPAATKTYQSTQTSDTMKQPQTDVHSNQLASWCRTKSTYISTNLERKWAGQRERSSHPQRKDSQTYSGYLSRNHTS